MCAYPLQYMHVPYGKIILNLHTSLGCLISIFALLVLLTTSLFFKEIPAQSRQIYQDLRDFEHRQHKREEDLQRHVEEYTLSGYTEWKTLRHA
jgi:hypothetical protein